MTCLGLALVRSAMILNGKLSLQQMSQWQGNEVYVCLGISASIVVDGT